MFGYGQTVYAIIKCQFELSGEILRLNYLESPEQKYFRGYMPNDGHRFKEIRYKLSQEVFTGIESIAANEFKFKWKLSLGPSPFPDDLSFPYDIPLIYYGHEEKITKQNNEDDN